MRERSSTACVKKAAYRRSFRRLLLVVALIQFSSYVRAGISFIAASRPARCNSDSLRPNVRRFAAEAKEESWFDNIVVPKDKLMESDDNGNILREKYPGGRDFFSTFWAIVQPAASLGFLVVGLSAYFGEPIVEWNPITAQFLGWLKPPPGLTLNWLPQGAFMCFYGFFGLFVFGPLQWYIVFNNAGQGVCEFNKKERKMTIVRDGELIQELDFDDIQQVKLEWTNFFEGGSREVYLITKDNQEVHFMETVEELTRPVLEKRAAVLSEFLDKELIVEDI